MRKGGTTSPPFVETKEAWDCGGRGKGLKRDKLPIKGPTYKRKGTKR